MRKKKKSGKSIPLAIIFFSAIIGAILLSLFVKLFLIVESSRFEEGNTFSIFVSNNHQSQILTFNKSKNSISILKIDGRIDDIYKFAEVPIAAVDEGEVLDLNKPILPLVSDIVFKIHQTRNNLNTFDALRIFFIAKTISPKDVTRKEISKNSSESQRDSMSMLFFTDPRITKEGLGIEVVNGTQESGAGNRFARLVSNIGGDVVLVSTGQDSNKSAIYVPNTSYTSKRLSKALNFPIVKGKIGRIAEITIVIGQDYKNLSKY